jgi:hypothetical protein
VSAEGLQELRELVGESGEVLTRIKDAASRLLMRQRVASGTAEEIALPDFVHQLHERLASTGRKHAVSADKRTVAAAVFDAALILDAVEGVIAITAPHTGGEIDVRVHFDSSRIAVIVEVPGTPDLHPETLLEPRLIATDGQPARLEPGLSALEECFENNGGQLFANRAASRWRFGLTLPNRSISRVA